MTDNRKRLAIVFALAASFAVLTGCAQANEQLVPSEFLTPEVAAFLATPEGKELVSSIKDPLLAEQRRNEADPQLSEFYQRLKRGDGKGAFQAIRTPAEAGNSQAQTELAYLYQSGTGVAQDIDLAIKWYSSAAENGNLQATSNLAAIFLVQQFGRQDLSRALPLFRRCAMKMRASCVSSIAYIYATQDQPDFPKALAWASIGADFGLPASKQQVAQLQSHLTQEELARVVIEKSAIVVDMMGR